MGTAVKKMVEAGKWLQGAIDKELYEKHKTMGVEVKDADPETVSAAFGPVMPLVYLEKVEGGIHIDTIFRLGGCSVFEGRKLNGKKCPKNVTPKKKKEKQPKEAPPSVPLSELAKSMNTPSVNRDELEKYSASGAPGKAVHKGAALHG